MRELCGKDLWVVPICLEQLLAETQQENKDFSHIAARKLILPKTWMNLEADSFLFQTLDEDTTWTTSWSVALCDETEDLLKPSTDIWLVVNGSY